MKARDDSALGGFWAEALGWGVSSEGPGVTNLEPEGFVYPDPVAVCIDLIASPEPKTVKNRVHVDLATTSAAHQAELVTRLKDLGATPADVGQGDVPGRSSPTRKATSSASSPQADPNPLHPLTTATSPDLATRPSPIWVSVLKQGWGLYSGTT